MTGELTQSLGLEVADLFPQRITDTTPEGRTATREAWRQSGWAAALAVLAAMLYMILRRAGDKDPRAKAAAGTR